MFRNPHILPIMPFVYLIGVLLLSISPSTARAQYSFQKLDVVEGWLIERRVDENQHLSCRASIKTGGTWFAARIHLDGSGEVILPEGIPDQNFTDEQLLAVRLAVSRCEESILYFP